MICGADKPAHGTIEVDGRPVRFRDPVDAIQHGIALLPEDRRHEGLVLNFGVRENITLASLRSHRHVRLLPFPRRSKRAHASATIASRLDDRQPWPRARGAPALRRQPAEGRARQVAASQSAGC